MVTPTYRGRPIRPDIPHVAIQPSYRTLAERFCFPIAITGMKCMFIIKFENVYEEVPPPPNFEWRIQEGNSYEFYNIWSQHTK